MTVASYGTLRQRREAVQAIRASGVVLVALDLFQLGREAEIRAACDGLELRDLLQLALVDYRTRYTDTRREDLIRCDVNRKQRTPFARQVTRDLRCLFCTALLATHARTREANRICDLMFVDAIPVADYHASYLMPSPPFRASRVELTHPDGRWCVADVADAIRPHVVVCALTSLACMQVPMRPGEVKRESAEMPLFEESGNIF